METQKIANSLNSSENEFSKFATKNGALALVTAKQMVVIRITIQLNF